MARVYLDQIFVPNAVTGAQIWSIFFNDVTKAVESEYNGLYNIFDYPGLVGTFFVGERMYQQCHGADQYEVYKVGTAPYGQVVINQNHASCIVNVPNSVNIFGNASGAFFGATSITVCTMNNPLQVFFTGILQVGTVLEDANGDPLVYSSNGWFRIGLSAYRIDASSEVIDIQGGECDIVPDLPEVPALPDITADPFLHLPLASSVTFVKDGAVANVTDTNTLFKNQRPPGLLKLEHYQVIETSKTVRVQWGSSYTNNVLKILDYLTGDELDDLAGDLVQANINQTLTVPGFAATHPEVSGVQVWFPNYPFPEFASVANKVNILSEALFGQFEVVTIADGKGAAAGNRVMVINSLATLATVIPVNVSGKYNRLPYNVYEVDVPFTLAGKYALKIEVSETEPSDIDPMSATSEPIAVTADMENYLPIRYTHQTDVFATYYGAGIVHQRWIKSRLYQAFPGGEKTINRQTDAKLVKVDEYLTRTREWELFQLPPYLLLQMGIALGHDSIEVNGIGVQTEDQIEAEYFLPYPLANAKVRLEETDFTQRARFGSIDTNDNLLLLESGGFIKYS